MTTVLGGDDLFGMLTNQTDGQLAGTEQRLSTADAAAAIEGYSASVLNRCLGGVTSAFNELGAGNRSAAVVSLDGVSAPCLSLEPGGGSSGPAYPYDLADPSVLVVGPVTYVYGTNAEAGNVQVVQSTDLVHWTALGNGLPALPAWAVPGDTWAPAVYAFAGKYILFYTAKAAATGQQCISEAVSAGPAGPYVDSSTGPLICQTADGGSIDPDPFVDAAGTPYLLWKSQQTGALPATLWGQQLDPSGLSLVGSPAQLLQPSQAWEGGNIEAPSLFAANGTNYLFYSANNYDTGAYAVGVAVCTTPLGPCTKPLGGPILVSADGFVGPGSVSVFTDTAGQVEMAFDAWLPGAVGDPHSRLLFLRPIAFIGGLPNLVEPS